MIYIVIADGEPSALDKEHIINTMAKASLYGDKIYFFKDVVGAEMAYDAAKKWKDLNHTKVELIKLSESSSKNLIPAIFDCVLYFVSEEYVNSKKNKDAFKILEEEGVRYELYQLGTWDKAE